MRNYRIDNIKAILIFLVVVGHLIEGIGAYSELYRVIYSFHMMIFFALSGKYASFNVRKIIRRYAVPYIVFQIIYGLLSKNVMHYTDGFSIIFPSWIMWYMYCLIIYIFTIPVIEKIKGKCRVAFLVAVLVTSILVGYLECIGYSYSLSRLIVFYPAFVFGKWFLETDNCQKKEAFFWLIISIAILVGARNIMTNELMKEATQYSGQFDAIGRILNYIVAYGMYRVFSYFAPNKETAISKFGANTLSIYLLHGVFVVAFNLIWPYRFGTVLNFLVVILEAVFIVAITGNKIAKKIILRM